MIKLRLTVALLFLGFSLAAHHPEVGWKSLFNGKDLTGWRQHNGKALFTVEDGAIAGVTVEGETLNSFLCTDQEFGDFILELEVFAEHGLNSGVQLRSHSDPAYQNGRVHGYQVEISPPSPTSTSSSSGGIYDEGRRGWLYSMRYNPGGKHFFKANAWNNYRIECIGDELRVWINGVPTAHLIDGVSHRGFIGLQVHGINHAVAPNKKVLFRNIRIKTADLVPAPPEDIFVFNTTANALSRAEIRQGYRLLWDGKTFSGWHPMNQKVEVQAVWQIHEGELAVIKNPKGAPARGGDLVSDGQFVDFELQFQFRLTEGANSGVKYLFQASTQNSSHVPGLEYQLLDDEHHPDAKNGRDGNRTLASLYDVITADKEQLQVVERRKIGEWNHAMVRVYADGRVEHWLNGYIVLQFNRNSEAFSKAVLQSKFAKTKGFGLVSQSGILLQDHGDEVAFRSIKIRPLQQ